MKCKSLLDAAFEVLLHFEVLCACHQTRVTNSQRYQTGDQASAAFMVDFGKRVVNMDPLQLFNLTGTDRKDVAFNVQQGQIYITAYVLDPAVTSTLTCVLFSGCACGLGVYPRCAGCLLC